MRKRVGVLPVLVILMLVEVYSRNHHRRPSVHPKNAETSNCPFIEELHNYEPPEIAEGETPPPKPDFCPVIPKDYCRFKTSEHAYKIHFDEKTRWPDSEKLCKAENATLVVVENGAQYDIVNFMGRHYLGRGKKVFEFHMGFKRGDDENSWTTVHGNKLPFVKWAGGEPNNAAGNEKCGAFLSVENKTNGFNDVRCSKPYFSMCEIKVPRECE
ncbi:C-type lectin lectoxin-Thr1-like [Diprion similis]|uniref:C-type lectin lectoxin-Thr1-like n=1 Tax=Diprion similis TaxID=362088 RepID=UPI001EF8285E|nr:C-type lectin lectoxin-Thr1-like [Diprion similis]XP_046752938.1 C-type lectin lectoxin-Thr1-like [Diprion similis]